MRFKLETSSVQLTFSHIISSDIMTGRAFAHGSAVCWVFLEDADPDQLIDLCR